MFDSNFSIAQVRGLLDRIEYRLRHDLGYDTVSKVRCEIAQEGQFLEFFFDLQDDFQKDLPYDKRIRVGLQCLIADSPEEVFEILSTYPSRKDRELRALAATLSSVTACKDILQSAEAAAFVASVIETRDKFLALPAA